jgi:hypothetical protein
LFIVSICIYHSHLSDFFLILQCLTLAMYPCFLISYSPVFFLFYETTYFCCSQPFKIL